MSYNSKSLVLIADDLARVINHYERKLETGDISTVSALTQAQLYEVFDVFFNEIDIIILDGCIPGHHVNTYGFIKLARDRGFTKPIIAASSLYEYRVSMVEAGCSHEADKNDAPLLARLLLEA